MLIYEKNPEYLNILQKWECCIVKYAMDTCDYFILFRGMRRDRRENEGIKKGPPFGEPVYE